MKAKHHFWSSLAAGGALYWATGSSGALAGAMLGGFVIDADHIFDQWWSIREQAPLAKTGSPRAQSWLARFFQRRKLVRLPLVFHAYELFAAIAVLTLIRRTPFLIGLLSGYMLHLALDIFRHHHEFRSGWFYLLAYRLSQRFRRDQLIKPEYL